MTARFVEQRTVDPADLDPYPGNPNVGDIAAIRASLRANGQYRAPVARLLPSGRLQVLAGHATRTAATAEAMQLRVDVIEADDATARRIVLADNRTAQLASYDEVLLLNLLREAEDDLTGTGWDDAAYRELLDDPPPLETASGGDPGVAGDDFDTTPPPQPVTQPGDVWLLGPHRIVCGDCRDPHVLARLMDGRAVDVAFTSPPYASQRAYDEASAFRPVHPDRYVDWFEPVQANVRGVLADHGSWFVNIKEHADGGQRHLYVKDLTIAHVRRWEWMFVDELCWVDTRNGVPGGWPNRFKDAWEPVFHFARNGPIRFNPLANGERSDSVFTYSPDNAKAGTGSGLLGGEKRNGMGDGTARPSNVLHIAAASATGVDHSAQFPVDLPRWFIRAYSNPGDTVLDPFMGSGTTLIAAHTEDRVSYGSEISPAYCDVIARRWQTLTSEHPILERTGELIDTHAAHDGRQPVPSP